MGENNNKNRDDAGATRQAEGGRGERDVGHALRSVYSNTVNEEVPDELLDLLGKLD